MSWENHFSLALAASLWALCSSLAAFIFWPIAAIASFLLGWYLTKLIPGRQFTFVATNFLITFFLIAISLVLLGFLGYIQEEWQQALFFVAFVHVTVFYVGFSLGVWLLKRGITGNAT